MTRPTRPFAPLALALGLALGLAGTARAQQEPAGPEGEKSEGRPLDGYLATTAIAGLALFLVGKSARR